ncbi:TIGR03943 family protein [Streptomyces sp. NPDC046985]|uniref:TIGR03943 family putative permease subunit n=1 Tax=Streptomyces sp. NPDC046985 TaxID=3155377 RepID=UPI0033DA841A
MNRHAQAAVLFLVGAAMLHAGATGLYLRYVKAGLQPLLLAAGAVLVLTALMTLWYERSGRERPPGPAAALASEDGHGAGDPGHGAADPDHGSVEHGHASGPTAGHGHPTDGHDHPTDDRHRPTDDRDRPPDDHDHAADGQGHAPDGHGHAPDGHGHAPDAHGHGHREPRISWLLVLPLLALILVAPPALGAYSAVRAGTALQPPYGYAALPASDPLPLSVVDYAGRAVYGHGRSISGRRVRVTGFVALDGGGTPYLVRMALNCCAADAQPVKIALTGRIPPVLRPDTWLEVTGTYTARRTRDPVNGGPIPFLTVTAAHPVPTPHDPYDETWNQ